MMAPSNAKTSGSTSQPSCANYHRIDVPPQGRAQRENQRRRTRKDLLHSATRLMKQGHAPTIEEIAADAMVSRATVYRYFSNVDALLREASIDIAVPTPGDLFGTSLAEDPAERVAIVDTALHDMILENNTALRTMLVQSLQRSVSAEVAINLPARQARRVPLIAEALRPAAKLFRPRDLDKLRKALALIIGPEAMIVCQDVLQLDDAESRVIKRWAIETLVRATSR